MLRAMKVAMRDFFMLRVQRGRILGWWQGAKPTQGSTSLMNDPLTIGEKRVYPSYTLRL